MKEFEHLISKRIKRIYRRSLLAPVLFLAIVVFLWTFLDVSHIAAPKPFSEREREDYVAMDFENLRFTGYTATVFGRTKGYYYYVDSPDREGTLSLVLLSPKSSEEGLPEIPEKNVRCRYLPLAETEREVLHNLAEDLEWTERGVDSNFSAYYFNEPDYHYNAGVALLIFLLLFGIYAAVEIVCFLIYIRFPHLCPAIRQLSRYGSPRAQLKEAEEELSTLPQLATEDLFITEHYFIEVADKSVAVVPIQEILWIYTHSTLHKFLWYHFSISYTLSLTARKHFFIQYPKNLKSDIDGIIDYLAEANHNILVGFSEANRLKVQEREGTILQIDKLLAFLNRRI